LHHHGDGYLRSDLRKSLGQFRQADKDPDAKAAAKAVEKLLATWPAKRDRQRLLDGCVAALLRPDENVPSKGVAWGGARRVLAWGMLQELIFGYPKDCCDGRYYGYVYGALNELPVSLTKEVKAKLVEHCRQVVAKGPEAERPFAASVLLSTAVGWAQMTEDERKKLLLSPQAPVWRWTGMSLVKNNQREKLLEWAAERPTRDHLDVIELLSFRMPKDWSDAELKFWLACTRRTPGAVAHQLSWLEGAAPKAFRAPIRAYLEKEIERPTVKDFDGDEASGLFAA